MTPTQIYKIERMASRGGFSHRCIAKEAFGDDSFDSMKAVRSHLRSARIKVTDYRNGVTVGAEQTITDLFKGIRAAVKAQLKQAA
jgi:hypothetical protein